MFHVASEGVKDTVECLYPFHMSTVSAERLDLGEVRHGQATDFSLYSLITRFP